MGSLEKRQSLQGERVRVDEGAEDNWENLYLEFEILRNGIDPTRRRAQQPCMRPHNWQNCKGGLEARPASFSCRGPFPSTHI